MKKQIILSFISIFITLFSISCNDQDFVVSADKPLRVTYISPSDGSINIPLEQVVTVKFSELVKESTVLNAENFYLANITDEANPVIVESTLIYDKLTLSATLTPSQPLAYSNKYKVVMTKKVVKEDSTNSFGGELSIELASVFTTVNPDELYVVHTNPAASAWSTDIHSKIEVLFSLPVSTETVVLGTSLVIEDITDSASPVVIVPADTDALVWSEDNKKLVFTPKDIFGYSKTVRVTLSSDIKTSDATAKSGFLKENVVIVFKTIDPPMLGLTYIQSASSFIPLRVDADGAGNTDKLIFTFTEGVSQDSVVFGGTLLVEDVTELPNPLTDTAIKTVEGSLTFNDVDTPTDAELIGDDNIVTFTPTNKLEYAALLRITLRGENAPSMNGILSDRATEWGGQLPEEIVYLIEVERLDKLVVVSTNVSGSVSVEVNTDVTIKLNQKIDCATMANSDMFYINQGTESDSANKLQDFTIICENGLSDTIIIDVNDASCTTGSFCYNELYTVTLEGGNEGICVPYKNPNDSSDDGCIESPKYSFTFSTESLTNINVISTNAAGSVTFDYTSDIVLVLSEDIDCATMVNSDNFYINKGATPDVGNKVDAFTVVCQNGRADTIIISVDDVSCGTGGLCFNTEYTVAVTGGHDGVCAPYKNVNDTTDNDCIKDPLYFFTFKTMDLPEFVAVIDPLHNSTSIPLGVNPTVTFSESILVASVTTEVGTETDGVLNNICLIEGRNATDCSAPNAVAITYGYTQGDKVVTLIPDASLLADTDYTIVVSRDIQDLNGRNLSGFYSASFQTSPGGLLSYIVVNERESITDLNLEMFFTEDIDVNTLTNKTVYLTFVNEFEGTTYVPGTIEFPAACDQATNVDCASAIFTPDFLTLFGCGENSLSPQYDLPLNTQFHLHLSSLIRNSDYVANPLHVPVSNGENEYLYNFITKDNNLISSVKYQNSVVFPVNLNLADEVPVNSTFLVEFARDIDITTVNLNTIAVEDRRGSDASIEIGTGNFTIPKAGTFLLGRDEGKFITLFGTNSDNGKYEILSVTDDKSVVLNVVFNNTEASVYWRRTIADDSFEFSVLNSNQAVITLKKNLIHHSDYKGIHGVVLASIGMNQFTLDSSLDNFKFLSNRDVGKKIRLSKNDTFNAKTYEIVSVNEITNTLTINGVFSIANESEIAWKIFDDEDYHRLIVKGRSVTNKVNYLKELDGTPIAGVGYYKFITSPATYVTFTPKIQDGSPLHQLQNLGAVFTREINLNSLTENSFYTTQNEIKRTGLIAYNSERKNVVTLIPSPALEDGTSATLSMTEAVLDYRGNPVTPNSILFPDVSTLASTSSIECDKFGINEAGHGPDILDGSVINGNQNIVIKFDDSPANDKCQVLPTSLNTSSILLLEIENEGIDGITTAGSSIFTTVNDHFDAKSDVGKYLRITDTSNAPSTVEGIFKVLDVTDEKTLVLEGSPDNDGTDLQWELFNFIPYDLNFIPRAKEGDYAEILPKIDMKAGKKIILSIDTYRISSVYLLSSFGIFDYNYTVEEVAPVLVDAFATQENGDLVSIHSQVATDIKSTTDIVLVFDEDIKANSANYAIKDEAGNFYNFTLKVENNIARLTPNQALKVTNGAFDYEVTIQGVRDRAGNPMLTPETASFLVETTDLEVVSISPNDADTAVSVNSLITMKFTEAIDATTLTASTLSQDGSFKVAFTPDVNCEHNTRNQIFGCIALNDTKDEFTFTAESPYLLIDETTFDVTLSNVLSDEAGNTLVTDYDFSFDTIAGDNGALVDMCVDLLNTATDTSIDVYFNKDLLAASLTIDSVVLYEVESGDIIAGTLTVASNVISFDPDTSLDSAKVYALIISDEVTDASGTNLVEVYRTFFNGSDL